MTSVGLGAARLIGDRSGVIAAALLGSGRDQQTHPRETTAEIDADVWGFRESLGVEPPEFVRVAPIEGATANGCRRAVARAVAEGWGAPTFGAAFWRANRCGEGLFLTAAAHAVLRSNAGELVDCVPKQDGGDLICYAVDKRLATDFDFLRRPNRHYPLPAPADDETQVRVAPACLHGKQLKIAQGLAAKAGLTLEQWIAFRLPADPLAAAIESFLASVRELEALLVPSRRGLVCRDESALARLAEKKRKAHRRMADAARVRWG
jgi:hypothetical protein